MLSLSIDDKDLETHFEKALICSQSSLDVEIVEMARSLSHWEYASIAAILEDYKNQELGSSDSVEVPTVIETLLQGPSSLESTKKSFLYIASKVLYELYLALCCRDVRYRAAVGDVRHSSDQLIAAVAGYVAGTVGLEEAVIAAVAASLLRLISRVGSEALCVAGKEHFLAVGGKGS